MEQKLTGIVRANAIVLDGVQDIPNGSAVDVVIRCRELSANWGEGIVRSAGGWADHPELNGVMEQIQAERKLCDEKPHWWTDEDDKILAKLSELENNASRRISDPAGLRTSTQTS